MTVGLTGFGWTFSYSKNLQTDYGATGDGSTSDNQAFTDFRTFARGKATPGLLIVPPGNYVMADAVGQAGLLPFDGIPHLMISAYGATVPTIRGTGASGIALEQILSARVQTVPEGATTLSLVNPTDISIAGTGSYTGTGFIVGRWAVLDALELQGGSGFPPNHHFNQFIQITGISGSNITFTPPAKREYKSTYPETSNVGSNYDTGGPATIHLLTNAGPGIDDTSITGWDTVVEIRGLTINNTLGVNSQQVYSPARSITYTDCTFIGCAPICGSNKFFLAKNCTTDAIQCENDKECEYVEFRDCTLDAMTTQSSSIDQLVLTDTTITHFFNGTAKHTTISGCTLPNLLCGAIVFGQSGDAIITNTTAGAVTGNVVNRMLVSDFTNSGGQLTYTGGGVPTFVPGPHFIGGSSLTFGFPFTISDIFADGSGKPVLVTNLPDPLPTMPSELGTTLYFVSHPMPSITATNFTGCPEALDLSTAPAGAPLFCHGKQTYTGNPAENRMIEIWGKLRSAATATYRIRVNVTQAYTGVNSTCVFKATGAFGGAQVILPNGSAGNTDFEINAKVAGERIIYSDSIVGAQSGDTLTALGEVSFTELVEPQFVDDLSGESLAVRPVIEWEILTDQSG